MSIAGGCLRAAHELLVGDARRVHSHITVSTAGACGAEQEGTRQATNSILAGTRRSRLLLLPPHVVQSNSVENKEKDVVLYALNEVIVDRGPESALTNLDCFW